MFPDTFRTPVTPKPEISRNTHPCGWQGSSSPSNFPLPTSSRKSTFVQARPNLPPTPSPIHNGFDLDFPRNQSFPDTFCTPVTPKPEISRNTHPCGWQGSSSPSNFPLPTSSRKSTFVQARPNLPPTPSPMHNGFDLNLGLVSFVSYYFKLIIEFYSIENNVR